MASKPGTVTGPSLLATFAVILAVMAGLFAIDTFLARIERQESRAEAERLLDQGRRLMQQGRNAEAIDRLRTAMSMAPGNREYPFALAQALAGAGRLQDAEAVLKDLLDKSSTDGPSNLEMARVLIKSGEFDEAVSYYHRAIYGQWKEDAAGNERKVRLELVDLLAKHGAKQELLAELLPLQDEGPNDTATRMEIGRLYLQAGSAARAADIFHQIVRQEARNGDAYDGLGQAEFTQGKYPQAHGYFLTASRLKPGDDAIKKRLDLTEQILDLDPTRRGLDPSERYRRSLKLVELSLDSVTQCAGNNVNQPLSDLMDRAKKALKARVSRPETAVEPNLELAEEMWQARRNQCSQPIPPADTALTAVLARVAQ